MEPVRNRYSFDSATSARGFASFGSPFPLFNVTFQPGGSFTFMQSVIPWPIAGTDSPWVTPGTITLTPSNFSLTNEQAGPTFLGSDWTISAGPEQATCMMALAGLAGAGFSLWRRRKRA